MRDPADPAVAAAIEETRIILAHVLALPGAAVWVREDDAIRLKAGIELALYPTGRGELSPDVRKFLLSLLLAADRRPERKGKRRRKNAVRDQYLVLMIEQIEKRGIKATRNDASHKPCGCSIVAQVLGELGVNLDERGVEDVWRQRDRHRPDVLPLIPLVPPVRG